MKQFKLATLAAAGLLATGLAGAGTLQVTPIQYAAETISAGQALTAPVFSYALAAPISVSSAPIFTFAFTLDNAVWDKTVFTVAGADNNVYVVSQDGNVSLRASGVAYRKADGTASATATDAATIVLTFTMVAGGAPSNILNGVGGATVTPTANYTFPVGSNIVIGTAATGPKLLGTAAMVIPANSCTGGTADTILSVVMRDQISAETAETLTGSPINFLKSNTYLRSSAALSVAAVAPSGTQEGSQVDVTSTLYAGTPSQGRFFTTAADAAGTALDSNVIAIGKVEFSDRGIFKDAASAGGAFNYTVATDFAATGAAANNSGKVSVDKLNMRVVGAYNTSGNVYMSSLSTCLDEVNIATGAVAALATATAPTATSRATLTATAATFTGLKIVAATAPLIAGKPTMFVCYKRDLANSNIPASMFTLDTSVSNVTHETAAGVAESGSPVCGTNLYNLRQNGVQFDLRNVVARTSPAYTEGWRSFVRIINTDEVQTAAVTGQVIKSDGVVLAGKLLVTLAPRAYKFLSTDDIETALTGSASAAYAATDGQNYRLRLTAPVSSLRAQNWLLNPATGNFIEASTAQGDEAPGNAAGMNTVSEDSRK